MTLAIGIDGIGGDNTKEGPAYVRAIAGVEHAGLKGVSYEIAVPPDRMHLPRPQNGKLVPHQTLESAIGSFLEQKMPIVTAFNTKQGMQMRELLRSKIDGIKRIPLAAEFPRETPGTILCLDLGGNTDMYAVRDPPPHPDPNDAAACSEWFEKYDEVFLPSRQYQRNAADMVRFARLGSAYMELLRGIQHPRVGLANIGTEEDKGHKFVETCDALLQREREAHRINYAGFAEPSDIDRLDVLVSDGFTGNWGLKMGEKMLRIAKEIAKRKPLIRLLSRFSKGSLSASDYSGAYLLGLRDIVVKIHGTASARDFATACRKAYAFAQPVCAAGRTHDNLCSAIDAVYQTRYCSEPAAAPSDACRKVFKPTS